MHLRGDWYQARNAQALMAAINDAGHRVYFVGGCVRNDLLGAPITDLDMSSDAHPEQIIQIANSAGYKSVPTGIEHGTVTVVVDGEGFEITTFRKDVATDGRRAVVAFSSEINDDARRRDFTMNALYADANGVVLDPLDGIGDIESRRVRFIENPENRIREDYLRTLRFFRFHAWYGDVSKGMDADALAAISANLGGLETLSRERVGAEMIKILSAHDPAPAMAAMHHSGVLSAVLPGSDVTLLPVLVHLEAGITADPMRRLALVGGQDVTERLRLSKLQAARLKTLRLEMGSVTGLAELAYRFDRSTASDICVLRAAMFEQPVAESARDEIIKGSEAVFPLSAADLMPQYQGRALGDELRRREARWIASGFRLNKEELLT